MKNFCFNRILAVVLVLVAVATIFFACSKSNDAADPKTDENDNKAIAAASYEAQASALYDDLFDVALQGAEATGYQQSGRIVKPEDNLNAKIGTCWTDSIEDVTPGVWPKKIWMKFGEKCTGLDGRVRAGSVLLTISDYILKTGSSITITLYNYSVNGVKLEGTKVITNTSTNGVFSYSTTITNGKLTLDSQTFGYTCSKEIKRISGETSPLNTDDDVYSGTGTAALTFPGGSVVTYTVKTPLEKEMKCAWIGKGTAEVTVDNIAATIDYGAGLCDDSATVSIGDKVKGVILK